MCGGVRKRRGGSGGCPKGPGGVWGCRGDGASPLSLGVGLHLGCWGLRRGREGPPQRNVPSLGAHLHPASPSPGFILTYFLLAVGFSARGSLRPVAAVRGSHCAPPPLPSARPGWKKRLAASGPRGLFGVLAAGARRGSPCPRLWHGLLPCRSPPSPLPGDPPPFLGFGGSIPERWGPSGGLGLSFPPMRLAPVGSSGCFIPGDT